MFDYLIVLISVISFWIALAMVVLLLIFRIYISLKEKVDTKQMLYITLMPFSIGYFLKYRGKSRLRTIYQILVIVQFVLMLIGLILILYTRYM